MVSTSVNRPIKKVSIIVPVYNERGSVLELYNRTRQVLMSLTQLESWEVIFVDDGSNDGSQVVIERLASQYNDVSMVRFRRNFGKAAALSAGFDLATGDLIITIDGDLQDDPSEIPRFIEMIQRGFDLVSGWKKERKDPLEKRLPSKIFNFLVSKLTRVKLRDFNCGFKAYRAWCVKRIQLTGNLYRFIPVLVAQQGGRIAEIPVHHHPRLHGKSKYGWQRYFHGMMDLCTVCFLTKFLQKPAYFFGTFALPLLLVGGGLLAYLVGGHVFYLLTGFIEYQLVIRPLLSVAVMLFGLGLQIFLFGLLAEMILSLTKKEGYYRVERVVTNREKITQPQSLSDNLDF